MSEPLTVVEVLARLKNYPHDNYLYLGSILKGVALYFAAVVGMELLYTRKFWRMIPWFAGFAAINVSYMKWGRGILLTNSRAKILREDARTVLKLGRENYDVIIAEPSNPWTVGVGSVFSREFYELSAARLKPGGIMAQWFHVYEMNDDIVEMVVRTFGSVFPVMEIWEPNAGDIIMLGSDRPWQSDCALYQRTFALETESARRFVELARTHAEVEHDSIHRCHFHAHQRFF